MLNATERDALKRLVGRINDDMGYACCNDFELPNTDEAWSLIEECEAENIGGTIEDWRNHKDYRKRPQGKTIITNDFLIFGYIIKKAVGEC